MREASQKGRAHFRPPRAPEPTQPSVACLTRSCTRLSLSRSMAAPKLRLLYFDIHGKAARIRTAALYGGVALEDYRFASRDEFTALKTSGALPFGQVPLLEVNGGEAKIAQSAAILRYVCGLAGLHPSDPLQAAAVDAALDQEADAFASYAAAKYRDRSGLRASCRSCAKARLWATISAGLRRRPASKARFASLRRTAGQQPAARRTRRRYWQTRSTRT